MRREAERPAGSEVAGRLTGWSSSQAGCCEATQQI